MSSYYLPKGKDAENPYVSSIVIAIFIFFTTSKKYKTASIFNPNFKLNITFSNMIVLYDIDNMNLFQINPSHHAKSVVAAALMVKLSLQQVKLT